VSYAPIEISTPFGYVSKRLDTEAKVALG